MTVERVDIEAEGLETLSQVLEARKRGGSFTVSWRSTVDLSAPVHCIRSLESPFFTNRLLAVATAGALQVFTRGEPLIVPETSSLDQREDQLFKLIRPFWPELLDHLTERYESTLRCISRRYSLARALARSTSRRGVAPDTSPLLLAMVKERELRARGRS